jgi:hypothetical protein
MLFFIKNILCRGGGGPKETEFHQNKAILTTATGTAFDQRQIPKVFFHNQKTGVCCAVFVI